MLEQTDFHTDEEYQEYLAIENADYFQIQPASNADKTRWKALADKHLKHDNHQ